MMKALAYLTIVCASICCLSTYAAEIQAIPKAFHGKWVGHIDKQLTPKQVARACRGDGGGWGTWEINFKRDGKTIMMFYPAGGDGTATIKSYKKFSATHLEGMQYVVSSSEGESYADHEYFGYALKKGKLHYTRRFDDGTLSVVVLDKCK